MEERFIQSYNSNIEGYYFQDEWWIYKARKETRNSTSNKLHSFNDNPAITFYNNDKTVFREEWYNNGILHRKNDPAIIDYYITGIIKMKEYRKNGVIHRNFKPASIGYTNDGKIFYEEYYHNGKLHNILGPAKINYYNKVIIGEYYYVNNLLHNLKGPAVVINNEINFHNKKECYILGEKVNNKYDKKAFIWNIIINKIKIIRSRLIYNKLMKTSLKAKDMCKNVISYLI